MDEKDLDFGRDIIKLLREAGFEPDLGLSNSIILKCAEAFETGKEYGVKEGMGKAFNILEERLNGVVNKYK